jgi:hypothetical protein
MKKSYRILYWEFLYSRNGPVKIYNPGKNGVHWTPNFSNADINIEMFFHEICRPPAPYSMLFLAFKFQVSFTNIELGVGGEKFSGGLIL